MCKRINIFFACFLAFYVAGSMAAGLVIGTTGIDLPYWGQCLISQAILLIPAFIYVFINKINIYKCIPYRKIKPLDAFLSLVFGYTLIPVVLFINVWIRQTALQIESGLRSSMCTMSQRNFQTESNSMQSKSFKNMYQANPKKQK